MSMDAYLRSLAGLNLRPNDRKYYPQWLKAYASVAPVAPRVSPGGEIPVHLNLVIEFVQGLRDHGSPAWQRLQAPRAVESYQSAVLQDSTVDLGTIRQTLTQIDGRELRVPSTQHGYDPNLVAAERLAGPTHMLPAT